MAGSGPRAEIFEAQLRRVVFAEASSSALAAFRELEGERELFAGLRHREWKAPR
jgi:hypothetical protein